MKHGKKQDVFIDKSFKLFAGSGVFYGANHSSVCLCRINDKFNTDNGNFGHIKPDRNLGYDYCFNEFFNFF